MPVTRVHHQFTVDEYEQMIAHGILTEDDRVELLRGEIVEKMTIGAEHAACVKRLNRLLSQRVADRALVSIQDPIVLADSEPEADVALLRPRQDFYASGKPRPADVFLLIEVADTALESDRDCKGPLYAENAIPEYWIVNLAGECVEVYRQPQPDGTYGAVRTLHRGEQVEVAVLPGVTVLMDELL